ncbi:Clr6 histone deacetylase complex subunit Pst2 [Schizosaccharomyces japonicus yFS275]|uniref:Clr6 histone deacetylase complex subunit Pst2 n=1 Tax=Schizosaccharomyces japonicus (strain yFS275 / FY16936) TaxID=402676 RepID=B6JYY1_SCHJY|nr:Clr6 histone deacetylase complex subunit Pst2 [Schizosaccharomyces japonicus yFS275]EEB06749.2 Clr6 histone deacetylase complex subunit Pst2 [Schizosaccharomyces japonicus yFS275]
MKESLLTSINFMHGPPPHHMSEQMMDNGAQAPDFRRQGPVVKTEPDDIDMLMPNHTERLDEVPSAKNKGLTQNGSVHTELSTDISISFRKDALPTTPDSSSQEDQDNFLKKLSNELFDKPSIYYEFLEIVYSYLENIIDFFGFLERIYILFKEYPHILIALNTLLPKQYAFSYSPLDPENIALHTPTGRVHASSSSYSGTYPDPLSDVQRVIAFTTHLCQKLHKTPEKIHRIRQALQLLRNGSVSADSVTKQIQAQLKGHSRLQQEFSYFLPHALLFAAIPPPGSLPLRAIRYSTYHSPFIPALVPGPSYSALLNTPKEPVDDLAFFGQVTEYLKKPNVSTEFFKLLNLFSQKIIDRDALLNHVYDFIGMNTVLWTRFLEIMQTSPREFEQNFYSRNDSFPKSGPSYRLLPKSEQTVACSGRDELAWSVCNDAWVSHPTWASEEAGFIVQRKTPYEETMTKLEEQRYEFDRHIEATTWTINLLEPIAERIESMSDKERAEMKLSPGLGGKTVSIYEKVVKWIYTPELGNDMIKGLYETPSIAVPLVLNRVKQKDEEWRALRDSLSASWRDIEYQNYDKHMDPQSLYFKSADKKLTMPKFLFMSAEMQAFETAKAYPEHAEVASPFSHKIDDVNIFLDVCYLVCTYIVCNSPSGLRKVEYFFKVTIPEIFGLEKQLLHKCLEPLFEKDESEKDSCDPIAPNRSRRKRASSLEQLTGNAKIPKLAERQSRSATAQLRAQENEREQNKVVDGEPEVMYPDLIIDETKPLATQLPLFSSTYQSEDSDSATAQDIKQPNDSPETQRNTPVLRRPRETFGEPGKVTEYYGHSIFYLFFQYLFMLYERLKKLKSFEEDVNPRLHQLRPSSVVLEMGIWRNRKSDLPPLPDEGSYYRNTVVMTIRLLCGIITQAQYEDYLRYFYGYKAYELYTAEKLVWSLSKQVHHIVADGKNKSILSLFEIRGKQPDLNAFTDMMYRMQVDKVLGQDEYVFKITWNHKSKYLGMRYLRKTELSSNAPFFLNEAACDKYFKSYTSDEVTKEISLRKFHCPFIPRNLKRSILPSFKLYKDAHHEQLRGFSEDKKTISLSINAKNYRLSYSHAKEDVLLHSSWSFTHASLQSDKPSTLTKTIVDRSQRWKNCYSSLLSALPGSLETLSF